MKKKLLLALVMTFVFALALTFAVSADSIHNENTVDYKATVTLDDGTVCNLFDSAGNALIWYISGTDDEGKNIYSPIRADDTDSSDGNYVKYYTPKNRSNAIANVNICIGNTTVAIRNIVVFNILDDDIDTYYYPKKDDGTAETKAPTSSVAPFKVFVETFNRDNKYPNNTMAIEYVYLRHDTTTLGAKAFAECSKLKYVNLESLTELTSIGVTNDFNYGAVFDGCTSLFNGQILDLSKTKLSSFTYGGQAATGNFQGVPLAGVKLPLTLTQITCKDFCDCKNLKTVYIGKNTTSIDSSAFNGCTALETIYYLGTESELTASNLKSIFTNATVKSYFDYQNLTDKSGLYLVYDYTSCAYNNGVHGTLTGGNACVGICSVCNQSVVNHSAEAASTVTVTYTSFLNEGTKTTSCTNEGCTYSVAETMTALFTCSGYSAAENGSNGVAIGFKVNTDVVAEYTKLTQKTVNYGVFAVLKTRLNDSDIFASDGTKADGVISAELTSYEFTSFALKIIGFTTDEHKYALIAMGAYVKTSKDGATEYSYMQSGTPNVGENYCFASYNDIIAELAAKG